MVLVMAATKVHIHNYEITKDRGACKCGRIVKFTDQLSDDGKFDVIREGDPNYKDPPIPPSPFAKTVSKPVGKLPDKLPNKLPPEANVKPLDPVKPEILMTEPSGKAALPPVPPKPEGGRGNAMAIGRYYDANRKQIEADVEKMGVNAGCKRWNLAPGNWTQLKTKWQRQDEGVTLKQASPVKSPPESKPAESDTKPAPDVTKPTIIEFKQPIITVHPNNPPLPPLPPFSADWVPEVQIAWFNLYLILWSYGDDRYCQPENTV